MNNAPEPLLIDERHAAKMLGISKSSLKNHRNGGLVPFVRIGRLVRYDQQDLRNFINALKCRPLSEQ